MAGALEWVRRRAPGRLAVSVLPGAAVSSVSGHWQLPLGCQRPRTGHLPKGQGPIHSQAPGNLPFFLSWESK